MRRSKLFGNDGFGDLATLHLRGHRRCKAMLREQDWKNQGLLNPQTVSLAVA